jgi:ABC-type molybdate transport system substrate-binding protein
MKDYKLLLVGLILLLLAIFIALFAWLWTSNRKNTDPLPIIANENESTTATNDEAANTISNSMLYVRAEENLQIPLDDVIISFESRYPHIQVLASYVPSNTLLTLPKNYIAANKGADSAFGTDIVIANDSLSAERLAPLQAKLTSAQHQDNQSQPSTNSDKAADANDSENSDNEKMTAESDNKEARTLNSFNYALRDKQALEGVILTDSTVAVSFRNFLLSSTGQGILEKYDYYNINGYKNSVNDLFKPTSRAKKASGDNPVDVADALSNGDK